MTGRPMFPTAAALSPAALSIASSICVVVVLPFVPVIPSHGTTLAGRLSRQASSTSLQIGTAPASAWTRIAALGGKPVVTTRSAPSGSTAVDPGPRRTVAPSTSSSAPLSVFASVAASSSTVTRAPSCSSPSAAAKPDTPTPAITTCASGQGEAPSARFIQGMLMRIPPPTPRRRCRARRRRRARR